MGIFKEVALSWGGTEFVVPAKEVMGLIETIEDHITFSELNSDKRKLSSMAKAYAAALNYAGARRVQPEEVYTVFFDPDKGVEINNIVTSLLMLMIPPEHLQQEPTTKKTKAPVKRKKRATAS